MGQRRSGSGGATRVELLRRRRGRRQLLRLSRAWTAEQTHRRLLPCTGTTSLSKCSRLLKDQFTTAQVWEDEALQAPRSSAAGARIEAPKAPRVWGCGEGVSPPHRGRAEEGAVLCPSPEKKLILALNMVSLVHSGFFYSSATYFTRKTGVIWCSSRYFYLQKGPAVNFFAFSRRQKFHAAGPVMVKPSECITLRLGLIARKMNGQRERRMRRLL